MSSRQQQEAAAPRQAPKLPQFPARKPAITIGQSPVRRNRVDSLPGVSSTGRSPGRPDPSRWGGTGAEKLHQLSKRGTAVKDDSFDDGLGGVEGFESPQLAKARAQVARDEVLSYMHHRRYQRKDTGARPVAHTEPRDTSFDDSDDDDDRDRLPASRAATAHAATGISGDAAQLLHRVQQTLDRWPPGGRVQTAHRSFGDDDLRPTSADQSPTRHARSHLDESAGSLSLAMPPAAATGGNKATAASSRCGGADSSTAVSRAGPGRRSTAGQRQSHDHLGRQSPAGKGSGASLSEDAFDFFKREVAARVIQTHWRRWQDWKAKVRREAEARILQQLLSDDSGLSLRMLLSGGSSSGEPSAGAMASRDSAAESAAATRAQQPSAAARPASAHAPGTQPTKLQIQLGRPTQHGRPAGGGGAAPGRPPADEGRPALIRPATAAAAIGQSRGKSPARGRATAPVGVPSSPARGERLAPGKPSTRGDTGAGRLPAFDFDDLSEGSQGAAGGADNASVQPSRKHVGGHAVYTFIATPQKQQAAAAAAAAAAPSGSEVSEFSERLTSLESNTIGRSSKGSTAAGAGARPAAPAPSDCATASGSGGTCGSGTASRDLHSLPASKPSPRMPSPSQQRQSSLDADTNPVMASPALSMATDGGSGDTVLGPASPVASMAGSSSNTGSQPSTTTVRRLDQPQALPPPPQQQPRGYPMADSRYQDASGPTQQADAQPRPQQQPHAVPAAAATTQLGSTANAGTEQQQPPVPASPPLSPTRELPAQPQRQDMSPSPQRQGRIVALQRLKMQGTLRSMSGAARNATGSAELVPAEPAAPPLAAALPHAPMDGASPRRHGASAAPTPREPEPMQELGAAPRLSPAIDEREPDLTPSSEPSLTPRGFRTRRQVWQEDSDGEAGRDDAREEETRPGRYHEQHGGLSSRQPRQQQPQLHQHQNVPRDVEARGRVHVLERDQEPRQQQPKDQQGTHTGLYEEASLRALHEAGGAAAPGHRRQTGPAPRAQPPPLHQDLVALTPRGQGQDTARRPRDDSPTRHTSHQQPRDRLDAASSQLPQARLNQVPDLLAAYPAPPGDRAAPQHAASQRPGAAGSAAPARPLTATAAEHAARHRGTAGCGAAADAPQPRITLAGDEDSLALLGARNQPRERELPQRYPPQQPADAAAGRHQFEAWPDAPSRPGVMDSPGRTRQLQAAGASARGAAGDASGVGTAPYARPQRIDPGFGSNGSCSPRGGSNGTLAPDRLPSPCSSRLRSAAEAKREGGGSGGARGGRAGADPRGSLDASVTAEKMSSILKYLDEVELQAEQEATCAALAPALLATEPTTAAAVAAALLPGGIGLVHAKPRGGGGGAGAGGGVGSGGGRTQRYDTVSTTSTGTRQVTNSSRPGTAGNTTTSQMGPQRSQAALSDAGTALRSGVGGGGSSLSYPRRRFAPEPDDASEMPMDDDGEEDDGFDHGEDAISVGTRSMVAGMTNRPAFLAESVYENVRAKIRRLQDDAKLKDARINELMQEIESLQAAQRTCLLDADARLSEMLAAQRAEYEAAVSRHMAFVDRLLADKEALSGRATQLAEQLKSADERQERTIAKLKEGWAAELKRQKEGWAAAEKQRREAWMQSKAAEIKDVTVKGLEGEVQKLLARHRAELSATQQAAADEARRHLDTYVAQNEAAVRQLKERMSREAEDAVEKERAAATARLREVSERYEQQLQTQRMRLVADADLRLEQLEQARKDDKKRYEEAVAAAKEAGEARLKDAEEDWRREKDAVRKAHEKQIDALREQYETGQEGWRAAMAERARKEVSERVSAIREKLLQERNEEVQAVMTRLEAEHAGAVEALKEDFRRREEAAATRAASALKEARRAEAKMAERFRNAGVATKAAEDRLAAAELTISDLRRELEARNTTIRFLESQVSAAKDEAAARERDVRSLGAEKAAVAAEVAAAVARDKQQVEARLAQALQEGQELRARHSAEMAAVEARVRATLARKDEVIAGLREQLAAMAAELRTTQEVLRQQQEELGSEVDGGGGTAAGGRAAHGEVIGGRRGGRY